MRIAIGFIGVVGSSIAKGGVGGNPEAVLVIGYDHYKEHLFDKNDNVDTFVHTWDTELELEIETLYKPKGSTYQKQKVFNVPPHVTGNHQRKQNHYSRWYSYKAVSDKIKAYETKHKFKYDMIMITRFDLAWQTDIIFEDLEQDKFYAGYWNRKLINGVVKPNNKYYNVINSIPKENITEQFVGYPYNEEGLIDQWFIANSDNMHKFCELYDHLDEYTIPHNCPLDIAGQISNHRLAPYHLKRIGLMDRLDFKYKLHDDYPLIRRWYFKSGK